MSVALGLGLGFFVLVSVAGVLGVGLVVGYQNTVGLLAQKAELIISSQREQTIRFFRSAQYQVDFISGRISGRDVEPGISEEFVSLLIGAVSATPQIIRIQFIDINGNLTGVERQQDQAVPIFQRIGDDLDLRRLLEEAEQQLKSDWGSLLWREEYKQAVLNYQQPVVLSGKVIGVMSAWISINQMSEFLSNLEFEFGANTFILHGRDQVLAHPLMAFGFPGLNRAKPLPTQATFTDPVVAAMWKEAKNATIAQQVLSGPDVRFVSYGDLEYVILFRELSGYSNKPLFIGTYFESHDMTAELGRLKWAIIICFAMSVISASLAAYIGRQIAQPARRLAEGSKKVRHLDLASVDRIPRNFFRELDDAGQSFNVMLDGLHWFERYVPKGLVKRLMRINPNVEVESSYREVAVMFTDIAGFTTISESLTAPATAEFLNDHFSMIAECVEAEEGTVDKFIGDSVMAVWGALERQPDLADRACRCAIAISKSISELNQNQQQNVAGAARLRVRIGIHLGRVVVGNIGSTDRVNYTVVGDAVNVAQRLEEAGKTLGDERDDVIVLVSGAIKGSLVESFDLL
ncbi:MAG: adenylate/guanylate cyclase domain-containing protein, partial [Nitrospirota bacterium]